MRFVCDSCRAQYMISDEKVGAKGVKVRCKKCGHVILVRRGEGPPPGDASAPEAEAASASETPSPQPAEGKPNQPSASAIFGGVDDDELGAVFDQALNPGSAPVRPSTDDLIASQLGSSGPVNDAESTRVMDTAAIQRLAEESEGPAGAPAAEKAPGPEDHEWFVAIDEKQTGPLTVAKIKEHWDRGEISADSLTWRAGLADWMPMSEVTELAAFLAPRPTKPIIVAPAPLSPSAPSAPVESAFSGSGRSTRTEIKPLAAAGPEEAGGWRPTAAHALVSLMKDEMAAMSRPTATSMRPVPPAPEAPPAGLLDVPPSSESGMNGHAHEQEAPARTSQHRAAAMPASAAAYAAPPPAYQTYRPGSGGGNTTNRTVIAIGGAIVLILLLLAGSVVYLLSRNTAVPTTMAAAPVAVAPAVAVPAAPPAAAPPVVAAASGVKPSAPGTAAAAPPAVVPPPALAAAPRASDIIAPGAGGGHRGRGRGHRAGIVEEAVSDKPAAGPAPADPTEDSFEKEFGAGDDKKPAGPAKQSRTTYVPPAPGSGNTLEKLDVSDIMQVVVNNKPAVIHCVDEQKKKEPGLTGTLVMHWSINTNGRTSGVSVAPQSSEYKSSYMAGCITGLVKGWRFPAHKVPHDPVDFPFKF